MKRRATITPQGMHLEPHMCIPSTVIKTVANYFNVSGEDLISRTRKNEIVNPRSYACYFLSINMILSLREIGKNLGIDHATVVHHRNKIELWQQVYAGLKEDLIFMGNKIVETWETH